MSTPMPGKFILDTNIVIALFAKDKQVTSKVGKAREIVVPAIVMGELYWARKSTRAIKNLERLDDFAVEICVMTVDTDTSKEYGLVKNHLRAKGCPIPENDVWIAALARQHAITLVSRDEHFNAVNDLDIVAW